MSIRNIMMNTIEESNSVLSNLSNNSKVVALETTLQQSIINFKELICDFERMHIEFENYKTMFTMQKEKCESKSCSSSEMLLKIIETKDHIIQLVASTLTRLNETKNFNILNEAFEILFSEKAHVKLEQESKPQLVSPKKETLDSSLEDVSFREESMSEIEGTPTGRTSPIIQMKKFKSLVSSSDHRDKKKCPNNWSTPESKAMKLIFSTTSKRGRGGKPGGRMLQSRFKVVKQQRNVVDLTCSPEFSGGNRTGKSDPSNVKLLIKKESIDSDDTILPSPTSGPTNLILFKSTKESPMKFKKPLSLKLKSENVTKNESKLDVQGIENRCVEIKSNDSHVADDSINILNPNRLPNYLKDSPVKRNPRDNDTTYCDAQSSVSVLQHFNRDINADIKCSPSKCPLAENINITNIPHQELESSISLLQGEAKTNAVNYAKRKILEPVEIVYKEPGARKKAEKRLLQGWSCDECKQFFGELYKDDPELYAQKVDECSKHRGKHNPARPKTPPNFWNPRWEVPDDTEEFNRKNNIA